MQIVNKKGDELYILFRPEENLRIGECLDVGGLLTQVVDIEYATLPGILEHILRKSMLEGSRMEEAVSPEAKDFLDTLSDHKLAVTKIRGTIEDGRYKMGFTELAVNRSDASIRRISDHELLSVLGLKSSHQVDFASLLSDERADFNLSLDRLGINLITGMKGSGKSYAAKKILLKLIEHRLVSIVFDLNGEYLNLWRDENNQVGKYAQYIKVLNPRSTRVTMNESPFKIPLNEVSYDEFSSFLNIDKTSQMYNELIAFWSSRQGSFDLNDLDQYVEYSQLNEYVKLGLKGKIRAARGLNIFGPSDISNQIKEMEKTGGAIIVNLTGVSGKERSILVDFVMRRLSTLGRSREINAVNVFIEEAQLYIEKPMVDDLLTRMRHSGVFPTFITNDPRTLPEEVFSLCDNLLAFSFHNPDDLDQIAKAKMIDTETLALLKTIRKHQCIIIGEITNNFPLLVEVKPETGVMMGGEARRLFS